MQDKLNLTEEDLEAIQKSFDVEQSYRRIKLVAWSTLAVAIAGLAIVVWGRSEMALSTLTAVFILYVGLAGFERASYMRAILSYKSALRKLTRFVESRRDMPSIRRPEGDTA